MKQLVVALILFGIVSAGLLSMPLTKKHNEIRHTKYYKQELHSTFHHLRIQHF